jgi:hypothetical protein
MRSCFASTTRAPIGPGALGRPAESGHRGAVASAQRAYAVVAGVVLDVGQTEPLEDRRHVVGESAAQGPSSARTSRRPGSGESAPRPRRCRRRPASARRRCRAPSSRRARGASREGRRSLAGDSAARCLRPARRERVGPRSDPRRPGTGTSRVGLSGSRDHHAYLSRSELLSPSDFSSLGLVTCALR